MEHHSELEEPDSYLRKRIRDHSPDGDSLEAGELSDGLSEDEDVPGCPLPSTPEDNELLEAEVSREKILLHISSLQLDVFLSTKFTNLLVLYSPLSIR